MDVKAVGQTSLALAGRPRHGVNREFTSLSRMRRI